MKKQTKLFGLLLMMLGIVSFTSCSSDDDEKTTTTSPGAIILSETAWRTTKVTDQAGNNVDLSVISANVYVGLAYYHSNGDFRIVTLEGANKMYGKWALLNDDKTRRLEVYDSFNKMVGQPRYVEILTLTKSEFTYRVNYDANDATKYYDVVHVPTNQAEPKTPAEILAGTNWKTTNIYDITSFYTGSKVSTAESNPVDPTLINEKGIAAAELVAQNNEVEPYSNYAGDAYYTASDKNSYFNKVNDYFSNGGFLITGYNNISAIRSSGSWYVSLDGKYRTLNAYRNNDVNQGIAWTRVVSIHELTPTKFTYDIVHGTSVLRVEHIAK